MSDHNPSDSFESHPESSGCSNDDFEQVDALSGGYYPYHDNGDADGPGEARPGVYDYGELFSTTANADEDEAEDDQYAAGASEAEAYNAEPLISFGDGDDCSFETQTVQPSAPDIEPAYDFASSTAADILSTIAPSASPPSSHFAEPISSTSYDDYEFNESEQEYGKLVENILAPEETPTKAPAPYEPPAPAPSSLAEPVSSTSGVDSQTERTSKQFEKNSQEATTARSFLRGVDPRELNDEEAEITRPSPFFKDLIYWRDVKKTGVVFGAMLVVLLSLAFLSVISVVAYLSLTVLTLTFSFVIYKKVMSAVQKSGDGHPFKFILDKDISLSEEKLKSVIQTTLKNANATLKELRHLFLVEDIVDSVKFGILLWALTYIGSWFSDMALIIIALVLVFTVPKLYETYQVQIDNYIGLGKAQINRYLSIIQSKVPFLKKKEKAQ